MTGVGADGILAPMAPNDIDVVRDQFEATNERDFARAMDLYSHDVVLVVHPEAFLYAGTFEGRETVGRYFGEWFSTFEPGYRFEIDEAQEIGDGVVFLVATHRGRGRNSGAEVQTQTGYHYTIRDGKVARVEIFAGRTEALEAASTEG